MRAAIFEIWCVNFVALLCALHAAACPSTKEECDKSRECHWSEEGTCISSIPCVLERTQADCVSNTYDCSWQAMTKKCERRIKRRDVNPECSILSQTRCSSLPTCYWSKALGGCKRRPTIILSVADDLGWYDIGFNNPRARTPTIDRLHENGINLDRHYTARFCAPTRAMFLSGRFAWKLGMQTDANLNPALVIRCAAAQDAMLLPEILKHTGGYQTHAFGKWHLGAYSNSVIPTRRGFDSFIGYYHGGLDEEPERNRFWVRQCACSAKKKNPRAACNLHKTSKNQRPVCVEAMSIVNETRNGTIEPLRGEWIREDTIDLYLAKLARDVLMEASIREPLFLYMAWTAPHNPVSCGQRHIDSITNSMPSFGNDARVLQRCPQKHRLTYLGMVMALDEAHSILLDALDASDRYENSIFIFMSDNGANMAHLAMNKKECRYGFNYPLRGSKYSWWEGGIRTVAFIGSPNNIRPELRGTSYTRLVAAVDWRRTIIRASGVYDFEDPKDDGIDLWERLSGFTENGPPQSLLRKTLPLQVWLETKRFVILFYYQDTLWKIMQNYPAIGVGAGSVLKTVTKYSFSVLEQPSELPRLEMSNATDPGTEKRIMCTPQCLLNLSDDPQELKDWSKAAPSALAHGRDLIRQIKEQGAKSGKSGLCEPNFYPLKSSTVTDRLAIDFAAKCGAFMPWLDENKKQKSKC